MNSELKSASTIHYHHQHYHYHYNMNDRPYDHLQAYYRDSTFPTRHKPFSRQFSNLSYEQMFQWKQYLDPEITRLYEEINQNKLVSNLQTYQTPNLNYQETANSPLTFSPNYEQKTKLSQSRIQLMHQIQQYQNYLKKRQRSYPYIPKTHSLIRYRSDPFLNPQIISNQDNYNNRNSHLVFEQMVSKKADSKIFNAQIMYESTTAKDSHFREKEVDFLNLKKVNNLRQTIRPQSQIKNNATNSVADKKINTKSQVFLNRHQNNLQEESQAFSLLQRSNKQEESFNEQRRDPNPPIEQVMNYQIRNQPKMLRVGEIQDTVDKYRYDLVKEQCQYLRNKLIEHIQMIHKFKF